MPISEKIIEKINDLEAEDTFKKLLLSILEEEDKGAFRFKAVYESLINAYLEKQEDSEE